MLWDQELHWPHLSLNVLLGLSLGDSSQGSTTTSAQPWETQVSRWWSTTQGGSLGKGPTLGSRTKRIRSSTGWVTLGCSGLPVPPHPQPQFRCCLPPIAAGTATWSIQLQIKWPQRTDPKTNQDRPLPK